MAITSTVDLSTLGWVKTEIDESLKQARQALESYADNLDDESQLRFCATHLHQVVGTLEMVQLDGAAMLAQEVEALIEAILDENIKPEDNIFEKLTRGILMIPDYLSRLEVGQPDVPLRLLPVVNELREVRNTEPLPEIEFFNPDLSVRPPRPESDKQQLTDEEYGQMAKKLRPSFQSALLAWLRDTSSTGAMDIMARVLQKLETEAHLGVIQQLFWVASGLLEAMVSGDLEATNERKKLFSRLDRQIKRLIDGTGKTDLRNTSETLVKNILYQLGNAKTDNPKVAQLKQAFDLDLLLGHFASEHEQEDVPTPDVLESVALALVKEMSAAQDMLAGYFDPEQNDITTLAPLVDLVGKMGSTMEMLGVPSLKLLVDNLAAVCIAIDNNQLEETDDISMIMARALLLVENSSRDISHSATDWKRQIDESINQLHNLVATGLDSLDAGRLEISEAELTASDYKQLLGVVADEVRQSLSKIEEEFETFANDSSQSSRLDVMLEYMGQVEGAFQIIDQADASLLVQRTSSYVSEIKNGALGVNNMVLDALAVCIGTIGAYIDGLVYNRPNLDALIDMAVQEIEFAAQSVREGNEPAEIVKPVEPMFENDIAEATDEDIELIDSEMAFTDETLSDAGLDETAETIELAPPPSTEEPSTGEDDFDEEIMEIFIEDARDSISTITKNMPLWRNDIQNSDVLLEIRRGFHTIKGSGRMVGASEIAELAWAYENLLNKIRDKKIEPSHAIVEVVSEIATLLPEMVSHLEGGPEVTADIERLRLRTHDIAEGKVDAAAIVAGDVAVEATEVSLPARNDIEEQTSTAIALDPTLLEIFSSETEGHLTTIRNHVAVCQETGSCFATPELIRAAHTLAGSARSVGLSPMSDACKAMEKLLLELDTRQMLLTEVHIGLLAEIEDSVGGLVNELNTHHECSAETVSRFNGLAGNMKSLVMALAPESADDTAYATEPTKEKPEISAPPTDQEVPQAPPAKAASMGTVDISQPSAPIVSPKTSSPSVGSNKYLADDLTEEDIDPDLAEIFYEEAVDILQIINDAQVKWRADLSNTKVLDDLKRALHTFKGGSRMSGATSLGEIAHNTETLIDSVEAGKTRPSVALLDLLDEIHDTLAAALEQINQGQSMLGIKTLAAKLNAFISGEPITQETRPLHRSDDISSPAVVDEHSVTNIRVEPDAEQPYTNDSTIEEPVSKQPAQDPATTPETNTFIPDRRSALLSDDQLISEQSGVEVGKGLEKGERREQIRVRTGLLDQLVSYAGEVSISRARMEQQVFGLRENLGELNQNVTRFREQLRDLEMQSESQILFKAEQAEKAGEDNLQDFDPLEFDRFSRLQQLSRSLTESLHDLSAIHNSLGNFASEAETVLVQQARVNTDLQEGLMRTRMVSFSTQATRLRHIVRQTARELGKNAQLIIDGADVELDRTVLERMIGPFEHMIRNALDHGVESVEERKKSGKTPTATIRIDPQQSGNEIVIRVSDDGRGLDIPAIRSKAIQQGLMTADSNLTDEEVTQFILMAGFSTAEQVSHISGRGVGMDVVHNEVRQLGGSMSVDTEKGKGTSFIISLPLTLSITQALMIYVGEQMFAIPLASVVNILELPVDEIQSLNVGDKPMLTFNDKVYPFMHLGARLGISSPAREKKVPVLLARSGPREVAMEVDSLGGTREIVIKSVGAQMTEISSLSGATIMGDGSVVLILDVPGLWLSDETMHLTAPAVAEPIKHVVAEAPEAKRPPLIMIVDDSLTVRKITSRHLQKRGMEVLTAKDGLDAVEQLRDHVPDVMLVDIEMPRMDGYELTARVRAESRLKHIPIIMITSRAGAKHKDKAMSLGVNIYMSKPYQEQDLVANIEEMLALDQ